MALDLAVDDEMAEGEGAGLNALAEAQPSSPHPQRQPDHVEKLYRWADARRSINIVPEILADPTRGEGFLGALAQTCIRQYQIDDESRAGWLRRSKAAMDLAMQITKTKTFPWPNSSNIIYPLISIAAIQFQSRAYPQIISGPLIVKGSVVGEDSGTPLLDEAGQPVVLSDGKPAWAEEPGGKQKRAERIGAHMSWQYLTEQEEWQPETDQLCIILPIVGCVFRKTFFDVEEKHNGSALVFAENLVINYRARSVETAARVTEELEYYPVEIEEAIRSGVFIKHDIGVGETADGDEDAPRQYIEQHRRVDLDGDGYPEPYKVTIHKASQKVVRIVSRYDREGIELSGVDKKVLRIRAVNEYTQYNFLPNPDGGVYGVGIGQLLGPLNHSINTSINQIFDAGTVANLGGGFVGKSLGLKAGSLRFSPGEYKMVNAVGASVRDSVVPLTFPGPSDVLFKMLGFLVEAARELSSNSEVLSGNQRSANMPATTTLALIEQGLKVFSGVFKRIYRSLTSEFRKQARLNRIYLDPESGFQQSDEWKVVFQRDYQLAGTSITPVADPDMVSDTQQLVRAEALKEFLGRPKINDEEIYLEVFKAMKLENPKRFIIPAQPDPLLRLKAMELSLKMVDVKSSAIKNLAAAIKDLADADATVQEQMLAWVNMQFTMLKGQMEALASVEGQAQQDAGLPTFPGAPPGAPPAAAEAAEAAGQLIPA